MRTPQPTTSRSFSQAMRPLVLWWAGAGVWLICDGADGQSPQIVRWEIAATVVDINDPLGLFPDVRLGDPVQGMFKYDANVSIDPGYLSFFEFDPWFEVSSMRIQNPRNNTELRFDTDQNGDFADVFVFNGYADENGPFDGIDAPQSVMAPAGFAGTAPVVEVFLQGPPTVFLPVDDSLPTQTHLPTALNLNDWPIAAIEFRDGWFSDPTDTHIQAEIHSLTPIIAPHIPGDYDYDGDVDAVDYVGWRNEFGGGDVLYPDGNGNGVVDAADYVVWRKQLGESASSRQTPLAVPEPSVASLLLIFYTAARFRSWGVPLS